MRTIRFARLRFERKLSHYADERNAIERRKSVLLDVIDYHTEVNKLLRQSDDPESSDIADRGDWSFGDVFEQDDIIAGRLAKVKERTERTPDDEVEGFPPTERKGTDASFFIIDLKESVMAYEYRRDVGPKAPFRILEITFNEFHEGEDLVMSPLVDKDRVREEIGNLQRISRVRFTNLTPTNPDSTDRSEPMDSFLQNAGVERLMLEGWNTEDDEDEADDEGIRVEQEPLLDGGLSLAEEGYGSALVEGEDAEGDEKEVSTDDRPIETEVDMAEEDDERNKRQLRQQIRYALDRLEE